MRPKKSEQQAIIINQQPAIKKKAFTIVETAEMLSIGTTACRALIKEKRILAVRLGRSIIVSGDEIDAFLQREMKKAI